MNELASLFEPQHWLRLLEIIWINLLLSGDNALVIALACRGLPQRQRMWGMALGAAVAVGMRIAFSAVVTNLMEFPYVKLIGGAALVWIAVSLLEPKADGHDTTITGHDGLLRAIKTIALADIIMSLDNVIAVAGAAEGNMVLLVFGLVISVPMIIAGAALTEMILKRVPALTWAGAALLGWIAGDMVANDAAIAENFDALVDIEHRPRDLAPMVGAVSVVAAGAVLRRMRCSSG